MIESVVGPDADVVAVSLEAGRNITGVTQLVKDEDRAGLHVSRTERTF